MADPQVRIFPHSKEEFPSEDNLRDWLLGELRNKNGGVYHLRTASRVKDLLPGSIVLFRHGKGIVGEAVVWKEKKVLGVKAPGTTKSGEEVEYEAHVTFAPSSIRLYAPPLPVERIPTKKDIVTFPGAYVELDWNIYGCILKDVVSRGTFVMVP